MDMLYQCMDIDTLTFVKIWVAIFVILRCIDIVEERL